MLKGLGYEVVTTDFEDEEALEDSLRGIDTLVSTIGGAGLWRIETAVVKAAKKAGVSYFVPSQFDVDRERFGTTDPFMAAKANIVKAAKEEGLSVLVVNCGYFADAIFDIIGDPWNGEAKIVDSDSPAKITFTRRSDVGHVLAGALNDPEYSEGGCLFIEGETMYWKDALDILMEEMKSIIFDVERLSIDEASTKAEAYVERGKEGDVWNSFKGFALHLLIAPASGNDGADMSGSSKSYGHKMSNLRDTLAEVYKALDDD
jgi:uncharacterized protein YbjT (DUF2867 family)